MKKFIVLLLAIGLCFTLCACGAKVESVNFKETEISVRVEDVYQLTYDIVPADIENPKLKWSSSDDTIVSVDETGNITALSEGTADITVSAGKVSATCTVKVGKKVSTETEYMKIEGLYLDKSYEHKDSENVKLLHIFYTVTSPSENLNLDSRSMKITFNGANTYSSEHIPDAGKYINSYYYSSYLQEVFKGDTLKVVETFKIPVSEFEEGGIITFEKSQVPQTENLVVLTDDVIMCENSKELAKKADPEGYKLESEKMKKADEKTTAKVRNLVNDYEWSFYVNSTSYKLRFYSPNKFELITVISTVEGNYTVRNGYITLDYPNGYTVDIPYEFEDGDIKLDAADAFDVMEG